MSQLQDWIQVLKGAQKVIEAGGRLHKNHVTSAWANSTFKTIPDDVCTSAKRIIPSEAATNSGDLLERLAVVLNGIKYYLHPHVVLGDPSKAGPGVNKAEIEELNSRFASVFDVYSFDKILDENTRNKMAAEKHKSAASYSNYKQKLESESLENASQAARYDNNNPQAVRYDIPSSSIFNVTSAEKIPNDTAAYRGSESLYPEDANKRKVLFDDLNRVFESVERDLKAISIEVPDESNNPEAKEQPDYIDNASLEDNIVQKKAQTSKAKPKAKQSLSDTSKQRAVPSTRLGRMFAFGSLAAGLGIGTATEYAKNVIKPKSKKKEDTPGNMFLSPANAERIVDTLCKVRGAALKLGQLLSLQDESVMPPELQKIFERVRQSADFMPKFQVEQMMVSQLGPDWRDKFATFDEKPFAAASIGQVHLGVLPDGSEVAVKIQYPGVAKGINSDIDNLVSVLNVWDIFPKGLFIDNIVEVAKKELAWEVDYVREAECTRKFKELLKPYPDYYVPFVVDDLCSGQVMTTELIEGLPLDKCFSMDYETRENIAYGVMNLCLREMFEFRCMQTDPNWSNFFYNPATKKLILLDFGATRLYSKEFMNNYIQIIKAASEGDSGRVLSMSQSMKFLTGYESKVMEEAHVETVMVMAEIFTPKDGRKFNFGSQDTTRRLQALVPTILTHRLCPPPEEIYSLHRKLSGVFLLCAKLKVEMDCRDMFNNIYDSYNFYEQ